MSRLRASSEAGGESIRAGPAKGVVIVSRAVYHRITAPIAAKAPQVLKHMETDMRISQNKNMVELEPQSPVEANALEMLRPPYGTDGLVMRSS
jgi:hypothetical protein